jgi:hypothetical protein
VKLSVCTGIVVVVAGIRSLAAEIPFEQAIVDAVFYLAAALLGGDYLYSKWKLLTEQRPSDNGADATSGREVANKDTDDHQSGHAG